MDTKVGLLHDHIRPDARDQFLAGDDFAGPFHQCDQDVECAATQLKRIVRFLEQSFGCKKTEWAKRNDVIRPRVAAIIHIPVCPLTGRLGRANHA
jgi:hypothetical protein